MLLASCIRRGVWGQETLAQRALDRSPALVGSQSLEHAPGQFQASGLPAGRAANILTGSKFLARGEGSPVPLATGYDSLPPKSDRPQRLPCGEKGTASFRHLLCSTNLRPRARKLGVLVHA